jgi:hypothetical protein
MDVGGLCCRSRMRQRTLLHNEERIKDGMAGPRLQERKLPHIYVSEYGSFSHIDQSDTITAVLIGHHDD